MHQPVPFRVFRPGVFLHGTRADLRPGDLLVPGYESNYEAGRVLHHIYFTETLDSAVWGAELARGDGPGRIYVVEPTGAYHDDPNVTGKRFPGNPTRSFRSTEPVRVVRELTDWAGHTDEQIKGMRDGLQALKDAGENVILD